MVTETRPASEFAQDKTHDPIVSAEIDNFEREVLAWRAGEGLGDDFRPFRLQHGTYGQRQFNVQMMRIKVPHGTMTPEQLHAVADCADWYTPRRLGHVTTRQAIQLHYVMLEDSPKVMRRLAETGLTTREACGHTVRNVTSDPLSGIAEDTVFDVTPYAEAAMRYFLRNATNQKLPRKFKITYSASEADRGLIPMHDFGLMAVERNGEKGFRMSVGGGLGAAPRMADVLADFLPVSEQLRSIEAAIKVWDRLGERRNKNKARIKFLVGKIGIEEFRRLWKLELDTLPPTSDPRYREPDFTLLEEAPGYGSWASRNGGVKQTREGFDVWRRTNALKQRNQGYYSIYVLLPIGDVNVEQMHALAEMARKYAGGHIRTAASQNFVLRWVHEDDLPAVHGELVDIGLAEDHAMTISDIITCPGADTCAIGVTSSKGLGTEIRNRILAGNGQYHGDPLVNDIRINVSGCPNSCGQHHIADIGFYGMAIRMGERQVPAFQLLLGGNARGTGKLAKLTMKLPARYIPDAVEKLIATYVGERTDGEKFASWAERKGTPGVQELLADYKIVPEFTQDPMAYVDWGQTKFFTLDDMGEGECAV
ncbi:MAG TPA: nitrite/sulfite reductase [Dehalococcoidia bacterium]|nr:nitrite/sulfite reductase [Dehalococcoidia bacterium]